MEIKEAKIIEIIEETEDVKSFILKFEERLNYQPGQFIMASFEDLKDDKGNEVWRAFSLSSSPTEEEVMITVKLHGGIFTTHLFENVKEGDTIKIKGPVGNFTFKEEKGDVVFIAAGSGIAPLRSMMKFIADKKLNINTTLLYTSRHERDIIFNDFLFDELAKLDNFTIRASLTQPHETWGGMTGRIGREAIEEFIDIKESTRFYICGPKGMVTGTKDILENLGVMKENINIEPW